MISLFNNIFFSFSLDISSKDVALCNNIFWGESDLDGSGCWCLVFFLVQFFSNFDYVLINILLTFIYLSSIKFFYIIFFF